MFRQHTGGDGKVLGTFAVCGEEDIPNAFGTDITRQDWFAAVQEIEAWSWLSIWKMPLDFWSRVTKGWDEIPNILLLDRLMSGNGFNKGHWKGSSQESEDTHHDKVGL